MRDEMDVASDIALSNSINNSIKKLISIIVPVYNEGENINHFFSTIIPILKSTGNLFEIICINDGSFDNTLDQLIQMKQQFTFLKIVDLSRNFGKEAALTAGLLLAKGDAVIPIDVDLQDPPEVILKLIEQWNNGYEVVLAKRVDRTQDSFTKRFSSFLFYKLQSKLSSIPMVENVGDFRLLDRKVVAVINQLPERQRYMKGLFSWAGFKKCIVPYARNYIYQGKSKFSYWKLWNFALDAITSFSSLPIKIWTYIGVFVSGLAFLYAIIIIIKTFIFGIDMPGYASIMVTLLFLSGLQFISLGILGEYIGRIFIETKQRPIYIIRSFYEKP